MAMTNTLQNLNAYLYNTNVSEVTAKEEELNSPTSGTNGFCSGPFSSNIMHFSDPFAHIPADSPTSPQEDMMRVSPPSSPDLSPVNNSPGTTKRKKRANNINKPTTKRNRNCTAKCSNCAVEQTPLWRKGADGKTLCNKCGLYWSRHSKHRPVRLDRAQVQDGNEVPLVCPTTPTTTLSRKPSLPAMNTKMNHSNAPALKAKKLESPLKRSFSFEEGHDRQQAKRKKLEFISNTSTTTRRKSKRSTSVIHEEVSNHSLEGNPFDDSDSLHSFTSTPGSTPSSVTAIQQQLAAFAMQQHGSNSHVGHSSENEVRVVQEQQSFIPQFSVIPPQQQQEEQNDFSNPNGNNGVPSDPFLAQLLTANNGDSSYYHHYLQNQLLDNSSNQQQYQQHHQQQQQLILNQSQVHQLQLQLQQRQLEQQQIQLAFNDNSNMHSPCGDNLDSLFSSLFGTNALGNGMSNSNGTHSLDSCSGSIDSFADSSDGSTMDGGFLGSPFL